MHILTEYSRTMGNEDMYSRANKYRDFVQKVSELCNVDETQKVSKYEKNEIHTRLNEKRTGKGVVLATYDNLIRGYWSKIDEMEK